MKKKVVVVIGFLISFGKIYAESQDAKYIADPIQSLEHKQFSSGWQAFGQGAAATGEVVGRSAATGLKYVGKYGLKGVGWVGKETGEGFAAFGKATGLTAVTEAGKGIEAIGKKVGSAKFWHGIARSFGASPSGYVYSCDVYNDLTIPIYVNTHDYASFMGSTFPKANGVTTSTVQPYKKHSLNNKEYYFEMTITADNTASSSMPYTNSNALYVKDCIQLSDKNSTSIDYYRSHIGRSFESGAYVHGPRAEYVGSVDSSAKAKLQAGSVSIGQLLSSLVFYNSTNKDVIVGYCSQAGKSPLKKSECDVFFTTVEQNSFALYNAPAQQGLPPGTVGLFEKNSTQASEVFSFPSTIFQFEGKDGSTPATYTLEIYQDAGQNRAMGLQGVAPGNYDLPTGRIRDITPITSVFWYQSVKQSKASKSQFIDLPGQVWVATQSDGQLIASAVDVGTSFQFSMYRPAIGTKQWIYFLYVDTTDAAKAKQFVQKVVGGTLGTNVAQEFEYQSSKQLAGIQSASSTTTAKSESFSIPQSLLTAALQGVLKLDKQGAITDTTSDITGYLLGADFVLPNGVGASSVFFYQLEPSLKTFALIPTTAVMNWYAQSLGQGGSPKGLPTPTIVVAANGSVVSQTGSGKTGKAK